MDYYSIGQCTPGIIAVNVSTFTGYKLKGIAGALVATAGIIAPSLIIIMTLANILNIFFDNPYVVHAFTGIRVVVIALMLDVIFGMWKKNIKDKYQWLIFILAVAVMIFLSLSPVWVVAGAAAFGLFMQRKTKK